MKVNNRLLAPMAMAMGMGDLFPEEPPPKNPLFRSEPERVAAIKMSSRAIFEARQKRVAERMAKGSKKYD